MATETEAEPITERFHDMRGDRELLGVDGGGNPVGAGCVAIGASWSSGIRSLRF
jgi:hypothetical protein